MPGSYPARSVVRSAPSIGGRASAGVGSTARAGAARQALSDNAARMLARQSVPLTPRGVALLLPIVDVLAAAAFAYEAYKYAMSPGWFGGGHWISPPNYVENNLWDQPGFPGSDPRNTLEGYEVWSVWPDGGGLTVPPSNMPAVDPDFFGFFHERYFNGNPTGQYWAKPNYGKVYSVPGQVVDPASGGNAAPIEWPASPVTPAHFPALFPDYLPPLMPSPTPLRLPQGVAGQLTSSGFEQGIKFYPDPWSPPARQVEYPPGAPAPVGSPSPGYTAGGLQTAPSASNTPSVGQVLRPGAVPQAELGFHEISPPKGRTRERKFKMPPGVGTFRAVFDAFTEVDDFINDIYGALPKKIRGRNFYAARAKGKNVSRQTKWKEVWNHWREADVSKAIENVIRDQAKDAYYGGLGQLGKHAANALHKTGIDASGQTGYTKAARVPRAVHDANGGSDWMQAAADWLNGG